MSKFHPFQVVARGSETQLQVGENLNKTTQWVKRIHKDSPVERLNGLRGIAIIPHRVPEEP